MARKKQSKGQCLYCGAEYAKAGMTKHLPVCAKRIERVEAIELKAGTSETLYHLRVQDAYSSDFWLDLEVRGSAKLKDIDFYLRGIWLECCGHLSEFYLGKAWGTKIGMQQTVAKAFSYGIDLTHIYDFGTSSETVLKLLDYREGKPTVSKPIALIARNLQPEEQCQECEQLATHLCMECVIEHNESGFLCDRHTEEHPHDNYDEPLVLVNSPRLGMCGYDGDARPPY